MSCAVFLDRDGTLNIERNYLHDPEALELFPDTGVALRHRAWVLHGGGHALGESAIGTYIGEGWSAI